MNIRSAKGAPRGPVKVVGIAETTQFKLFVGKPFASVLVELDKGWPDCGPSVAPATLSQWLVPVITAAGSNGRTT